MKAQQVLLTPTPTLNVFCKRSVHNNDNWHYSYLGTAEVMMVLKLKGSLNSLKKSWLCHCHQFHILKTWLQWVSLIEIAIKAQMNISLWSHSIKFQSRCLTHDFDCQRALNFTFGKFSRVTKSLFYYYAILWQFVSLFELARSLQQQPAPPMGNKK